MRFAIISAAMCLGLSFGLTGAARAQTFTEFAIPSDGYNAISMAVGAGGNIWFVGGPGLVERMTPAGVFSSYAAPTSIACAGPSYTQSAGATESLGKIAAGPDGAMWFTFEQSSRIGRISAEGAVTQFSVASTGCADLVLGEITAGSDGAMWFTEALTNRIGRITTAGQVTEFALASGTFPQQIAAGPDGNLWFSGSPKKIFRITPTGVITEFPTPGSVGHITAGPDGNIWYSNNGASANNRVGRVTPAGVVTEFLLPTTAITASDGITVGPDGNIWFSETLLALQATGTYTVTGSKIGRITPIGNITEFALSKTDAHALGIVSAGGVLWFAQAGQTEVNFGGPDGKKITRVTLPTALPPIHIASVFSTSQSALQSYVRLYNTGDSAGTVRLTLSDPATGLALASYTTPAIAPGSAPQFGIATIEAAAAAPFTKPSVYTLTVEPEIGGYVQHVLYRPSDGTITDLSTCDRGVTAGLQQVANVHTKTLATGFPSSIVIYNGGGATAVTLGLYSADTGTLLGTYVTPQIAANGQITVPVTTMENAIGGAMPPSGLFHYVIKAQSAFTGYLQHLVNNQQAGVTTDMSMVCAMTTN